MMPPWKYSWWARLWDLEDLDLKFLWDPGNSHVLDFDYMTQNNDKLPPDLHKVLHAMLSSKEQIKQGKQRHTKHDMWQNQVRELCGLHEHSIRRKMEKIYTDSDLKTMAIIKDVTLRNEIRRGIQDMSRGPMLQLARAAQSMLILRKSNTNSHLYHENWKDFKKYMDTLKHGSSFAGVGLMSDDEMNNIFDLWSYQRLDLKLSFCNMNVMENLFNTLTMMFSKLPKQVCGTMVQMFDCYGGVRVQSVGKNKNSVFFLEKWMAYYPWPLSVSL